MRGSLILTTALMGSLFLSGCAFNTVSNTTIKKEHQSKMLLPPPPAPKKVKRDDEGEEKKIKKIVKETGVPRYGPNIYKTVGEGPCGSDGCAKTKYDITQDRATDFPVSYRPKRETIVRDVVLVEE